MKYSFIVGSIFKTLLCLFVTTVTLSLAPNKVAKGQNKVTQYQENYVNKSSNLEQNNGNSKTGKVEGKTQPLSSTENSANYNNNNIENIDPNTRAVKDSETGVYFIGPGTFKVVDNYGKIIRDIDPNSGQYEITTVNELLK
ncbi:MULTISPECIES: hypothetical protein [Leuconostoc]|uniref:hypothetical protein n=1 Tax=Leuconostoc TaxID=1243 RepID=UPI0021A9A831|nr:hypothetical protein [Leuconostoc pseudomesenteroides]MCT4388776.1 hypothetical protein [Leuconostoc pseudomesenteroides]